MPFHEIKCTAIEPLYQFQEMPRVWSKMMRERLSAQVARELAAGGFVQETDHGAVREMTVNIFVMTPDEYDRRLALHREWFSRYAALEAVVQEVAMMNPDERVTYFDGLKARAAQALKKGELP